MTQCTKRQGIYSGTRTWVIVGEQLLLQLARVHLSACTLKSLENKTIVQIVTLWIFTLVFICYREEILWLHHLTNIIIICHIYFLPFDHDLLFVNLIDFNACIGDYIPFPFPPNRKGHLNVAEALTLFLTPGRRHNNWAQSRCTEISFWLHYDHHHLLDTILGTATPNAVRADSINDCNYPVLK